MLLYAPLDEAMPLLRWMMPAVCRRWRAIDTNARCHYAGVTAFIMMPLIRHYATLRSRAPRRCRFSLPVAALRQPLPCRRLTSSRDTPPVHRPGALLRCQIDAFRCRRAAVAAEATRDDEAFCAMIQFAAA